MNTITFLLSPEGQQLTHAVVLVLVALAAYLSAKAREQASENAKKLDGHLAEHVMGIAHTTSSVTEHPSDDM